MQSCYSWSFFEEHPLDQLYDLPPKKINSSGNDHLFVWYLVALSVLRCSTSFTECCLAVQLIRLLSLTGRDSSRMRTNLISEWMLLLMLVVSAQVSVWFYMPEFKHIYSTGEPLYAKVSSLTSIDSLIPLTYYGLPYCKPPWGVKKSEENLGELLMGDEMVNSPYRFRANVNESVYLCTTHPLTKHDVDLLEKMTRELYQVNVILDNLPALRYVNIKV